MIALIPDHCLSIYFQYNVATFSIFFFKYHILNRLCPIVIIENKIIFDINARYFVAKSIFIIKFPHSKQSSFNTYHKTLMWVKLKLDLLLL